MTNDAPVVPVITATLDTIANRLKLYATTIVVVGALIGTVVSSVIVWATMPIHTQLQHIEAKAAADSVRFAHGMDVLELAVVAVITDPTDPAHREAIETLLKRRRFTER